MKFNLSKIMGIDGLRKSQEDLKKSLEKLEEAEKEAAPTRRAIEALTKDMEIPKVEGGLEGAYEALQEQLGRRKEEDGDKIEKLQEEIKKDLS